MKNRIRTLSARCKPLFIIVVLFAVFVVYFQVGHNEFIHFDDDIYVTDNIHVNSGFTRDNLLWAIGFGSKVTYWHPLTWISHMLDCQLFGLESGPHHMMSLSIHLVNTLLLFIVLRRMTGAVWQSTFVAALFGLHPVNVDSVAWLAERKNLLSTTFWLLTMLAYAYYVEKNKISRYIALLVVYLLGLLSKPMLITLPFSLFLLDYWPLKRFQVAFVKGSGKVPGPGGYGIQYNGTPIKRLVLEKIPLFALCIASILISTHSLSKAGLMVNTYYVPMSLRVENAIVSYLVYISKMVWPVNLTFFYPYPESIPVVYVLGSLGMLLLATATAVRYYSRAPYFLIGWLWFLGTLFPVSGIVQAGLWPAIAERWAYVPYIGLFIMVAWGISACVRGLRYNKIILSVLAVSVLLAYGGVTWRQAGVWKSDVVLFTYGMKVNPGNYVAVVNMGAYHESRGEYKKAVSYHMKALAMHQGDILALGHLASIYDKLGEKDKAIGYYSSIIRYLPNDIAARYELGSLYAERGDSDKAISEFVRVIKLDPRHQGAYYNLGVLYAKKGQAVSALNNLTFAVKYNPQDIQSRCSLGVVLMNMGKISEAVRHFQYILNIDPDNPEAIQYLASAGIYMKQRKDEIARLKEGQKGDPGTLYKLAVLQSSIGEYTKAIDTMNMLLRLQPKNANIYYNLACIYSSAKMVDESLAWLKKSVDMGFRNWQALENDPDLIYIRDSNGYKELLKMKNM